MEVRAVAPGDQPRGEGGEERPRDRQGGVPRPFGFLIRDFRIRPGENKDCLFDFFFSGKVGN